MTTFGLGNLFSSKILRNGLAFVTVMIVLEVFWFALLVYAIGDADRLSVFERQQGRLTEEVDMAYLDTAALFQCMSQMVLNPGPTARQAYEDTLRRLKMRGTVIKQLTTDPEVLDAGRKREQEMDATLPSIVDTFEQAGASPLAILSHARQIKPWLVRGASEINYQEALMEKLRNQLEEIRRRQTESAKLITIVVALGFAFTLILIAAAVFFFLTGVTSRLSVLVENAYRLPMRLPLNQKVGGDDELSYLDKVLHDAAADLEKAAEHRKTLMQMVAHDLRSPLTSCQLELEATLTFDSDTLSNEATQDLNKVEGDMQRIVALVNDLLTVDQLELGYIELACSNHEVCQLAADAIQSVRAAAQSKNLRLSNKASEEAVHVDRDRIVEVLVKYLSNAIRSAPPDSTIEVLSRWRNGTVEMSVRDGGPGLSLQEQRKLFKKSNQARDDKTTDEFALGLAICRLIVESHGGQVGVESQPGRGARYWFTVAEARSTQRNDEIGS